MQVDEQLVDKLAHLARLEFNGEEKQHIIKDLDRILGFVAQLQTVNTDGVEPLIYLSDEVNVLRADEAKTTITKQEALKNAPKKDSDYFRVPKVMEQ